MARVKVRTVFTPHIETEMSQDEAETLRAQRLLVEDKPAAASAPEAAPKTAAKPAGKDA